ncbi:MAG: ribonuclease III [Deltaproteobacteria bacterium]|nr:ribonuclease III [Deltaproteobacteria bacterium]
MKAPYPNQEFETLYEVLGYRFRDPALVLQAFRHSSYVNEHVGAGLEDNERLEFLGDAVIDLAVSHLLMEKNREADEGTLSRFRSMVVDEAGLHAVATRLELGCYLLLGKGEDRSLGRQKPSILADVTEALIGAIYLDGGFDVTKKIIEKLFAPLLKKLETDDLVQDFKSLLQEFTQQTFKSLPKYRLTEETGPAHDKVFRIALAVNGIVLAEGKGKSKKEAEQRAAKEAFFCLKKD